MDFEKVLKSPEWTIAQDKKEVKAEFVKILFKIQDGTVIKYQIKVSVEFGKMRKVIAKRIGLPVDSLRLLLDGRRIKDIDTPLSLELNNEGQGNVIEIYNEQTGGN